MKPGPKTGSGTTRPADDRTFMQKAADAWGDVTDWMFELASMADRDGLKSTASAIGYSPAVVSFVLNNKYGKGDIGAVEQRVRGAMMGLKVECPILGEIGRDRCLQEQQEPFRATSAFRAQIFHECRSGCPHARLKGTKNGNE